jgi:hypothetical protein
MMAVVLVHRLVSTPMVENAELTVIAVFLSRLRALHHKLWPDISPKIDLSISRSYQNGKITG